MKHFRTHNWQTERISRSVLYAIIALSALVFGLFYLVGYDTPDAENANFNSPMFTSAVIILAILLVIAVVAITVWAFIRSIKSRERSGNSNNIPARKIANITAGATCVVMILSFLFGSDAEMNINGKLFTDHFWLKTAGMFVSTCLVMIALAICAAIYGATRYYRKN